MCWRFKSTGKDRVYSSGHVTLYATTGERQAKVNNMFIFFRSNTPPQSASAWVVRSHDFIWRHGHP